MGKYLILILISVGLCGCSNTDKEDKAFKAFYKQCNGTVAARFIVGTFSSSLEVYCQDFKEDENLDKEKVN